MASDLTILCPRLPQPSVTIVLEEIKGVKHTFCLKGESDHDTINHLPIPNRTAHQVLTRHLPSFQDPSAHQTERDYLSNLPQEMIDAIIECLLIPGSLSSHFRGLLLANKALSASTSAALKRKRLQRTKWLRDLTSSTDGKLLGVAINDGHGLTLHQATRLTLVTLPWGFRALDEKPYKYDIAHKLVMMVACLTLAFYLEPDMDVAVRKAQQHWVACRWRKACWYLNCRKRLEVKAAYGILMRRLCDAGVWVEEIAWEDLPI